MEEKIDKENKIKRNRKFSVKNTFIIFIIFFVLTIAITIQINTVRNSERVGRTPKENKLRDLLLKDKENYAKLEEIEKKRENTLDTLRENASKNNQRAKETIEKLNKINKKLGLVEVSGPGIVITLTDAIGKKENTPIEYSQLIVHDMDILHIINILRNAGAESIAVNGQRIVGNTGISCIGVVIKINEEKIGSPYEISAIGNQDNLESSINMIGGIRDLLKGYGLTLEVRRENNLKLPKYTGLYTNQYNRENEE